MAAPATVSGEPGRTTPLTSLVRLGCNVQGASRLGRLDPATTREPGDLPSLSFSTTGRGVPEEGRIGRLHSHWATTADVAVSPFARGGGEPCRHDALIPVPAIAS